MITEIFLANFRPGNVIELAHQSKFMSDILNVHDIDS